MFYVKAKIGEHTTICSEITEENTFTVCPMCGNEHAVDLSEIFSGGDADLYSTAVYCHDCSRRRAAEHRGEPWAEQVAQEE